MALPILKSKPGQYHHDDIPKPIDVEICPVCNTSICHEHGIRDVHPIGEE